MSVQDERFYVRFKGRVLGPLTRDKTLELAKRGQITKQHELSPDGVAWKQAHEFAGFFTSERAIANQSTVREKQQEASAPEAPTEEWYAHFNNSNQGPVDSKGMKNWIANVSPPSQSSKTLDLFNSSRRVIFRMEAQGSSSTVIFPVKGMFVDAPKLSLTTGRTIRVLFA